MLFIITVSIPNAFYTSLPRFPEPHTNTHTHTHIQNITCIHMLVTHICLIRCFLPLPPAFFCLVLYFLLHSHALLCVHPLLYGDDILIYTSPNIFTNVLPTTKYICGLVRCNMWLCVWNHSDSVLQSSYTYECVCCLHTYTTSHLPSRVIHPFIHPSRPYSHPSVYPFYTHIPIHVSKLTA